MQKNVLIKNAGFMWHRKYINWESRAKLIGYPETGKGDAVNFADQAGIYALYDHNYKCLYVGQAGRGETNGLYHRLRDHVHDYLFCMWERFSWFGFYSGESLLRKTFDKEFKIETNINDLMNIIESVTIHIHFPLFNKLMGRDISKIQWFYQTEEYREQEINLRRLKEILESTK